EVVHDVWREGPDKPQRRVWILPKLIEEKRVAIESGETAGLPSVIKWGQKGRMSQAADAPGLAASLVKISKCSIVAGPSAVPYRDFLCDLDKDRRGMAQEGRQTGRRMMRNFPAGFGANTGPTSTLLVLPCELVEGRDKTRARIAVVDVVRQHRKRGRN